MRKKYAILIHIPHQREKVLIFNVEISFTVQYDYALKRITLCVLFTATVYF